VPYLEFPELCGEERCVATEGLSSVSSPQLLANTQSAARDGLIFRGIFADLAFSIFFEASTESEGDMQGL